MSQLVSSPTAQDSRAAPTLGQVLKAILKPLASLRLTVALLALAMFLVFAGTLAQVNQGIWEVMQIYFRSWIVLIPLSVFSQFMGGELPGVIPFPGGWLLGGLLLVNLVAAHAVRFKFSRKRIGIVGLHAGVILMLLGELVTGLHAQEGRMTIEEGSYAHFAEDLRTVELAVIDESDPDVDHVVVVPEAQLANPGSTIKDARLPFDVRVETYMPNSAITARSANQAAPGPQATHSVGIQAAVVPLPKVTGTDPNQTVDVPSAYVTLLHEGETLGTWLVTVHLGQPQRVQVGDREYGLALRFKRLYKPYTLHLIDFRHDKFVGTNKARNFSSQVRLVDPEMNVDREVLIYMNHPLRHRGETLYQHSFFPDESGTQLQVVDNPGWLIPYIACAVVTLGMMTHFGMSLAGFLRRAKK